VEEFEKELVDLHDQCIKERKLIDKDMSLDYQSGYDTAILSIDNYILRKLLDIKIKNKNEGEI
jgi:hypothetical protein